MIGDNEKLAALLPCIQSADWIALDTEADSLHAYPEKLCLLQISMPGEDVIVDPLARIDLAPLLDALRNRELILHGADYDLRLLWKSLRFRPHAIVDTMWAARFLGCEEFGLTQLVAKFLGVTLEKGPQKMNWARRPLTERMEQYARNDTRYLRPLASALCGQLEAIGRMPWLREVCARMISECAQDRVQNPDTVWRIKGSDRLSRRGLAVLREVWQWREARAIERNRPPYFVLSHERLTALAAAASDGVPIGELPLPSLHPPGLAQLTAALERGLNLPPAEQPNPITSRGLRLTKSELRRFEEMKQRRDEQAEKLKIDPTLIASRSELIALSAQSDGDPCGLMAWQRELLFAAQ